MRGLQQRPDGRRRENPNKTEKRTTRHRICEERYVVRPLHGLPVSPMANQNASAWQNNSVLSTTYPRKKPGSKQRCFWLKSINLPLHPKPQSRSPRSSGPYLPHSEQRTRPSTYRGYKVLWREIKPFCEGLWTRDVRTRHVQAILEAMAKTNRFNINSLKHIKSFLSGIFRLAAQQGYYEGANPVRETSLPQVRQADETYAYSLEEVLTMIDAVPEPASTLIAAAAFTGARRGELRGMFWENYSEGELLIARSIWNGITTDPKSRKSKAPIPIIPKLAAKLEAHRAILGKPKVGPIFPNAAGNAIDPDSLLRRAILPALEVCEICSKPESEHGRAIHEYERNKVLPAWRGWHAFRRGLATNL